MIQKSEAKVILVGAGPGDPELITLKALKAIKSADVILYDALIDDELLEYAPNAIQLFVGKRIGKHKFPQDEINQLAVEYALNYGTVVRLKGGDPFIFGRGSEEKAYIESKGVPCEVISGVSSSSAVPASLGIPLTERGVSESFWVITGTTSAKTLSKDVKLAAQSSATVVILMGMTKLKQIRQIFLDNQKANTPCAIIQNGTTNKQNQAIGTIDDILEKSAEANLSSPAIIIIGEVVKNAKEFALVSQNIQQKVA